MWCDVVVGGCGVEYVWTGVERDVGVRMGGLCVQCGLGFCFFFFFKQKTAYEIGTGDWSSDVCSSDLGCCRSKNW